MMHQGWTYMLPGDWSICLVRLMALYLSMMDFIWISHLPLAYLCTNTILVSLKKQR